MIAKFFVVLAMAVATNAGLLPLNYPTAPAALVAPGPVAPIAPIAPVAPFAAAYSIAPYASSYSAHAVNHAVAEPVYAQAPFVAPAPAPLVAPAAPVVAARYFSSPFYL